MNYIKSMQLKVKENEEQKKKIEEVINDLYTYMGSKKFRCGDELDGYINIQDVRNYLDKLRPL